ncbi:hypothetical protein L9F63_004086, partial [Diploptera punctata]
MDNEDDILNLISASKNKIWEDKKRLGLKGCEQEYRSMRRFHNEQRHGMKKKSPCSEVFLSLPDDVREIKKDVFISHLTSEDDFVQRQNFRVDSMVRFGEYSPQNPGLLSPGKTLLGLGEYEEKRRQILERKKREYLEHMAQARQDLRHQQDSSEFLMKHFFNDSSTQTDLKITGYIEGEEGLSPMAVSTQTPGGEVPVLPNTSSSTTSSMSTQTSGGNVKFSVPSPVVTGFMTTPQPLPVYHPLSPRERKMAEFRESYSPSFLQGLALHQGGFEMSSEPDMRRRREAYQEELRKQIEEKRRIEAEEEEKERRKEAAISRRAELQRERMRQEYVREETLRRERQLQ